MFIKLTEDFSYNIGEFDQRLVVVNTDNIDTMTPQPGDTTTCTCISMRGAQTVFFVKESVDEILALIDRASMPPVYISGPTGEVLARRDRTDADRPRGTRR